LSDRRYHYRQANTCTTCVTVVVHTSTVLSDLPYQLEVSWTLNLLSIHLKCHATPGLHCTPSGLRSRHLQVLRKEQTAEESCVPARVVEWSLLTPPPDRRYLHARLRESAEGARRTEQRSPQRTTCVDT
jgi:hypothetical protein